MLDPERCGASPRRVFGLSFSLRTQAELAEAIVGDRPQGAGTKVVATANLDHIVTLRSVPAFRRAYENAWQVTADGMPVFLYARACGIPLGERITGSDLFAALVDLWRPDDHRLFFLVSAEETGRKLCALLAERGFDPQTVRVEVPPFGFERDDVYSAELAARIARFGPTHLVMGVGAPKSEIWADDRRDILGEMFVLCVGASIEFVTGDKRRAPPYLRRMGLEWLWRFATEPRRLFKRYFVRSFMFLFAILTDLRTKGARC
jgi:N-acetylglucosaminyldiphosphoundecaprenol N-acetyl-beta-D-mannosaminyltransferase